MAYHNLVVPAYIIEIEEKTSLDNTARGTLYSCLKVGGHTKTNATTTKNQSNKKKSILKLKFEKYHLQW